MKRPQVPAGFAEERAQPLAVPTRRVREDRYDAAPKRAVNLRIAGALIDEAKAFGVNLSEVLQAALKARVIEELGARFARDNASPLASIDAFFEEHGALSEHFAAKFG